MKKLIIGIIGFGKLGNLRYKILKKNKNLKVSKIFSRYLSKVKILLFVLN